MTKVIDGQNISLSDAICNCGFKRLDDQQFELVDGDKKFVLSNLVGIVKEIPAEEPPAAATPEKKKGGKKETPEKAILAAPQDPDFIDKENIRETKALEENGFHIVGGDGYQSGGGSAGSGGKNNNVNKEGSHNGSYSSTSSGSSSIVKDDGEADGSHLESKKDKEARLHNKSKYKF